MVKILCVAEKPSISKAVAGHLSGGLFRTTNTQNQYIKNYTFTFDFGGRWGNCDVVMTCVSGHLTGVDFPQPEFKNWSFPPPEALFDAPIEVIVDREKTAIASNITAQARGAKALFIWTDCDREGEHIGGEVRTEALKGNPRLEVKRARFSNIERAHILQAAKNPIDMDDRQVKAVAARIEIDLRIGAAFTRYLTTTLQRLGGPLDKKVISYGSCQFPTLGFVVDRYFRVKNFVPETFWGITVKHKRDDIKVVFNWKRNRLFDRMVVTILFERCILGRTAKVTKVTEKPTSKWKPLPLTTVELQKNASRFLRMNGQEAMKHAESLYQKGFLSYPRTETDSFDQGIDLRGLVDKQVQDPSWGGYAQDLMNGDFDRPRQGRNDDKAHPPIHPVAWVAQGSLPAGEKAIYEFVVKRFLACCSRDARGSATDVEIEYGDETFGAHGLVVLEKNYLKIYTYEKWEGSGSLPNFRLHEVFEPDEAMMTDGKTTAPNYLTEPDLIALMDANGIGTDATMAEHIQMIQKREYVALQRRGGGARGVEEFIPTTLGMALVDGYDRMEFETSLSKPFLRKEMELKMKEICEGRLSRGEMLRSTISQYRQVFLDSQERVDVLKSSCRHYVLNHGGVRP